MEKINIRGVNFLNTTLDGAAEYIWQRFADGEQTAVFTPNSEIVQNCIDTPELYETVNSAEVIIPDGIGVIKAAKILGTPLRERIPGVELGERIIRESAGHGAKIFFLGSKPGVAETAAEVMKERYPSIDICGCRDGYFKKEGSECDEVVGEINESAADILFVCLGAPGAGKMDLRKPRTSLRCQGVSCSRRFARLIFRQRQTRSGILLPPRARMVLPSDVSAVPYRQNDEAAEILFRHHGSSS